MDGTGDLLALLAAALEPKIQVHVIRYPVDQEQSYAELDLFVRDQLPASARFLLLGESFSGPIAASPPPGLVGLILSCTFASVPREALAHLPPGLLRWPMRLIPLTMMIKPVSHLLLGRFGNSQLRQQLHAALAQVNPEVLICRMREVQRVDVRPRLGQIKVPVMYMQAEQDSIVPAQAVRPFQEAIPALKFVRFVGPHGLLATFPQEASAHIQTFCAEVSAPAP